jgi:hypothetical protein
MAQKVRIRSPWAVHRVMNRGERREAIGADGEDRQSLLRTLTRAFRTIGWRVCVLLAAQVVFVSGCTSALWDKETFAHHYRPSDPVNLHLFYSKERRDVLVQYDESKDYGAHSWTRCYWLEPNTLRVNEDRKPHFVSTKTAEALHPLAVGELAAPAAQPASMELCAVARPFDNSFTLYSGKEQLESYKLPTYVGGSQTVKQVLLTPFAVAVDATIIGAIIGYHSAPGIFASLSR